MSYVEAAGLLRYLYEREYGIHARRADAQVAEDEARLAARYSASKRSIPIDPDYTPE